MTTNPLLVEWSALPSDVLSLVYERLSFADFVRARTVCSSWYSVPNPRKNHVPWLIFKQDGDWKLFDPEEGKVYITQISRLGFAECHSLATCGNWVLVTDKSFLYIINPFTLEVINKLPPLKPRGKYLEYFPIHLSFGSSSYGKVKNAVLCVDERNKDYLVAWTVRDYFSNHLHYCMKGDEEWFIKRLDLGEGHVDHMVYKDKKLYILSDGGEIMIMDLSQDVLRDVSHYPSIHPQFMSWFERYTKMRLTTSGDVLLIRRLWDQVGEIEQFKVYKVNSNTKKWKVVKSLDEEEELVWKFCDYYWDFGDDCHDFESSFLNVTTYKVLKDGMERVGDLLRGTEKRWLLPSFVVEE